MNFKKFTITIIVLLLSTKGFAQLNATTIGSASNLGSNCYQITPNTLNQTGGVWYDNAIDFSQDFTINFQGNFGSNDSNGADGMAIAFKGSPNPVVGNSGGGIAYEGIGTSLIVEFDTWQNTVNGDPFQDHIAIMKNGVANHNSTANVLVSPVQASSTSANIEDGVNHDIKIEWIASTQTFNVYFDCVLRASVVQDILNTVFFGDTSVFFGFVASTGGSTNLHQVCFNNISFVDNLTLQDQSICLGNSVTLDATIPSGVTYTWSPTNGISNPNIPNPIFSPTSTTAYAVNIGDACGDITSEDVTITVLPSEDASFTATPTCDGGTMTITGNTGGSFAFNPAPSDAAVIDVATGTVTNASSGATYTIEYTTAGPCPDSSTQTLTVLTTDDPSFTTTPTCDGGTTTITGTPGGTFAFNPTPSDGAVIDSSTGTVTNATSGVSYTIEYTTSGVCPASSTQVLTVLVTDNPSFNTTSTCDGGTMTITGTTGGVFSFNPVPSDGAVIDSSTGTVTNATQGVSYTIEYNTTGVCPSSSTQSLTVLPLENASFTTTPSCDGGTMTITGNTGGSFAFNPAPSDAAVINAATGTVTNASSGATYTIEYTTAGPCPVNSTQTLTVLTTDDSSFSISPTCDGGTITITGTSGGSFAFNPTPSDAAVIDPVTGTVSSATPGSSYGIVYTTSGVCFSSTSQTLNVLAQDNSSFSMTPSCDGGTASVTGLAGGTFSFAVPPADAAIINSSTGTITGGSPGMSYDVTYQTNGTCPSSTTVTLTVFNAPVAVTPTPLEVCDDATPDGITAIDLTLKNNEITAGNAAYVVSYYGSSANATAATNALSIPYTNVVPNTEVVWVRVEESATGCFVLRQLTLMVEQAPAAFTPPPLTFCDPDSDGFGIFDLTQAESAITGGASGLNVTYHETLTNANNNANPITNPTTYPNVNINTQTIWVRVESASIATNCATIVELQLIVNPTPQLIDAVNLPPIEVCDDISADGFATFDLTLRNNTILNGIDPLEVNISYYEDQNDAQTNVNAIATPTGFTNTVINRQTLWVRVTYNATGCYKLVPMDIIVNPLPPIVQPSELQRCDDEDVTLRDEIEPFTLEDANAEILNGQTGISLSYYLNLADAQSATNALVSPYSNISNPQTIYVRAENDITGCVNDTVTLTLRVNPPPSPEPNVTNLVVCDEDNDGFSSFDLSLRDVEIINGEANVVVSYHLTQIDADTGNNPLASPYNNVVQNTQVIFVRVENTITGCSNSTTSTLTLVVEPIPVLPATITDFVVCDADVNGFTQFDLTTKISEIYGSQSVSDFTLTFHQSQADAMAGNNAIVTTSNYTNTSNPQTLWVRLLSNTNGCFDTANFDLIVNIPPTSVVTPTPLEVCEDLGDTQGDPGFGFTQFDLTSKNNEITANNTNLEVAYFETLANAQNNVNVIADPTNYTNLSIGGAPVNPQTLFVRVADPSTGCAAFTTLTISVLPNPSPTPSANIPTLKRCDDNNTGNLIEAFDLTENEIIILNGETGNTVTYHTDALEADAGTNAIADPTNFENTTNPQTIYVRVTNASTACYELVEFNIEVNPLPNASASVNDIIGCELNTDGFMAFDLTQQNTQVLAGQDPTAFSVSYHASQADAENLQNALVSSFTNTTQNSQQIFVAITNNTTGCSIALQSFYVRVNEAAQANSDLMPIVSQVCDDQVETDGNTSNDSAQFDLSLLNAEVLDGQNPNNYVVSYYASQADADAGINPLPTLYENTINPQILIARVDNNTQGVSIITLDVAAIPVSTPLDFNADGNPDTFDSDGDGVTDLIDVNGDSVNDGIDVNGDGFIDFIDTNGDGQGDLVDLNNDGLVDNGFDNSICYATTQVTLQVLALPNVTLQDSYTLCLKTNGTEVINPNPPVIDTGLSTNDFSFEWIEMSNPSTILGTGATFTPTAAGTYQVEITDLNAANSATGVNCTTSYQTIVNVSEPPVFTAEVSSDSFSDTHIITVTLNNPLLGDYEYSLNNGPWQDENVFTAMGFGNHLITVRDKNGCGYATQNVTVIDYPKFFTPNEDGFNETWNIATIENAKIYIFDRYGKLLKQISSNGKGWNGTYNGQLMPSSDYWFIIKYQEIDQNTNTLINKEFKANFALKR